MSQIRSSRQTAEVAHVLFIDIVGSTLLPMDAQRAAYNELNEAVCRTGEYRRAAERNTVLCRPTGDGMALVFFEGMESPLLGALELASVFSKHPRFQLRMGIHSGEVLRVRDINGIEDVTGDGIITARRIMDCGEANHILVSSAVGEQLDRTPAWSEFLRYIGTSQVKHAKHVALWNLYTAEVGNPKMPQLVVDQLAKSILGTKKKRLTPDQMRQRKMMFALILTLLYLACTLPIYFFPRMGWTIESPFWKYLIFIFIWGVPVALAVYMAVLTTRNK